MKVDLGNCWVEEFSIGCWLRLNDGTRWIMISPVYVMRWIVHGLVLGWQSWQTLIIASISKIRDRWVFAWAKGCHATRVARSKVLRWWLSLLPEIYSLVKLEVQVLENWIRCNCQCVNILEMIQLCILVYKYLSYLIIAKKARDLFIYVLYQSYSIM